jgi:hypothetical protein
MMLLTATWGLGYAALAISLATSSLLFFTQNYRVVIQRVVLGLLVSGTILLWSSQAIRIIRGHGWPFQTPADLATGIVLLMLAVYAGWSVVARQHQAAWFVSAIAFALLSYVVIKQPPTLSTQPLPSPGVRADTLLNLGGGAFLALASAASLSNVVLPRRGRVPTADKDAHKGAWGDNDLVSEAFVRLALLCLASSLAVDTWWLQKIGLGNPNDAQQAGIAITWMVYFFAIRLRTQPDWRGWPWTAIVTVGFGCTLPILLNVPWLEMPLSL